MTEPRFAITSRVLWEDYCAIDALNMSRLKEIGRSPQHYLFRLSHELETKPLTLGKAAHCAVLEPERFDREYVVWDRITKNGSGKIAPRTGEQWESFQAEHVGKTIITVEQRDFAMAIQQAVRSDALAMRYLENGDPEVTMEWEAGAQWGLRQRKCKARADWLCRPNDTRYVVGLKTTIDARPRLFGSQAAKLEYPLSWAWYHDGYKAITGIEPRMVEIVVESKPPHAVVVYPIREEILLEGRDRYLELLKILAECEESGLWPGPSQGTEQELTLPTWYYGGINDDLNDLGLECA
jgi:exodeoxyribonuclease VIII